MKLPFTLIAALSICIGSISGCVTENAGLNKENESIYELSGEPHARDDVSTVIAELFYDEFFGDDSLSLRVNHNSVFDTLTSWPNGLEPKNFTFEPDQKYRVTLVQDNRLHPTPMMGKYGTTVPTIVLIETLEGDVLFDGSICPLHNKEARRAKIPIVEPFSDSMPDVLRRNEFPYGNISSPTMKATWAPDTRETVLEYVCSDCLKSRENYPDRIKR